MSTILQTSHTTHYDTLGVAKDATEVEIKKCFRRLSLEFHPDRNVGTETRYKQIVEAYTVLGDTEKRRLYDVSLKESLLERALTTRRAQEREQTRVNDNGNGNVNHNGFDNRLYSYDSDGYDEYSYGDDSDNYNLYNERRQNRIRGGRGRGGRMEDRCRFDQDRNINNHNDTVLMGSRRHQTQTLEDVQHTLPITLEESFVGVSVPITITRNVNGKQEEAKIYVDVPAGTDNGEIIILEGKGHIDADLRMKSHVRVRVAIERHETFRRDGLNIVCSMELSLKEALCGFKKEITHLDGKTYLVASEQGRIIGQGSRRVIPNKGFQRGHSTGNLVIIFSVVMPKSLTQKQIEVLTQTL